jgi:hypothetical protein
VGFVQNEHLKAIIWNYLQMQSCRLVGCNNGVDIVWTRIYQVSTNCGLAGKIELRFKFFFPLMSEKLWAYNHDLGQAAASDKLTDNQASADRLAKTNVVRQQSDWKALAKGDQICDLVTVGF